MKIVFLIYSYYKYLIGGSEHQAFILAKNLVKRGYEVHYIFVNSTNDDVPYEDDGIILHPLKLLKKNKWFGNPLFSYRKQINKKLKLINPDFIYHRNLMPFLGIACKYCKKHRCKVIWHIASKTDVEKYSLKLTPSLLVNYLNKKLINFGILNTDMIITQENYHNEQLLLNYNKSNTILINKFFPVPNYEIKKKDKPISVVWIANIKPIKQLEKFIELARKYESQEDILFKVIGKLPDKKTKYGKFILKKISSSKNLFVLGKLHPDEVNNVLANSHIFVNTSLLEGGVPVTFIQAWLNEVPVLSLNVNPDNVFNKYKVGYYCNTIDVMTQKLDLLINNKTLRKEMGKSAKSYCIKYFSMENIDLIEKLLLK
ncbi:glycosyltransferase family 4 protein [Candidatus Sulfidibacterium hydrothermale]|uniref:glycosyltransferase family 4 protein n=1 Tax=Candidatus Sulfidibacterium hydrothermale TaxID=2875962 RepID=UPI001F0A9C54|nr:glycosyltransferase family 4 protein [Candidatus Sulfidibacterium hydrothermale]UBM62460.1 glycosyltransferase family 4 protein [Candidatus Sulfidibacterium hydrothermale]